MSDDFSLIKPLKSDDPRLGRHVNHNSKSLRYLAPRRDPATLISRRHEVFIPILDQLDEGSCTGHGGFANLCSGEFWKAGKEALAGGDPHEYAVGLYSAATEIDPWPGTFRPDDTGSDGLSIAKVLKTRGLISGYLHATSLDAVLTALARQVIMIGSSWNEQMYDVAADGQIRVGGATLGGHEYVLDEIDVERRRAWLRNSWGPGWGIEGRAWMSWDDLGILLADFGDCTVLVPREEPAPQPQPAPTPEPTPAPDPQQPEPDRPSLEDLLLADALQRFLKTGGAPTYLKKAAVPWLKGPM